jgi:predicted RNase H-like HicB family nuclease
MGKFRLEYWEDDGWFVGQAVEVPGILSRGEALEEVKENIEDAYKLMVESEPLNSFPATRNRTVVESSS